MDYIQAKRKWFKKNVASFTVSFYWAGWNYEIVHYEVIPERVSINNISFKKRGVLYFPKRVSHIQEFPEETRIIQQYFKGLEPCELFFEARSLKIRNIHNSNFIDVTYKTFIEVKSTMLDIIFGEMDD